MIIYEEQKRFNQYTGEPLKSVLVRTNTFVCDYCGSIIEEDSGLIADTDMSIKPLNNMEAWFHEDRDCLGEESPKFDLYQFFEKQSSFHFCTHYDWSNCETILMMEWLSYHDAIVAEDFKICLEQIVGKLGPLYTHSMRPDNEICGVFSRSRYRVLRKILGSLKPEQLGIEFE